MFEAVLDWLRGSAKLLGWFISSVVIPLTIWFTVLRGDVSQVARDQVEFKTEVRTKFKEIDEEFHNRTVQRDAKDQYLNNTLGEIQKSIGRVEGELKRISR
jgi:hypothetical protein